MNIITIGFPKDSKIGGGEMYANSLNKLLKTYGAKHYTSFKDDVEVRQHSGIEYEDVFREGFFKLRSDMKKMWNRLDQADLIICHLNTLMPHMKKRHAKKTILVQHKSEFIKLKQPLKVKIFLKLCGYMKKMSLSSSVVFTEADKENWSKYFKSTYVVPLFSTTKKKYDKYKVKRFISIGRLDESQKRYSHLWDTRGLDISLYGSGIDENLYKGLNRESNYIKIKGSADGFDSIDFTNSAMLMTSDWEGMPFVAIEALSSKVPVIMTDCCVSLNSLNSKNIHFFDINNIDYELKEYLKENNGWVDEKLNFTEESFLQKWRKIIERS